MNFDFLKEHPDFEKLYTYCRNAEALVYSSVPLSIAASRMALEHIVKFVCASLKIDKNDLFSMLEDQKFINYINDKELISAMHFIRMLGNDAIHDEYVSENDALNVLQDLQSVVGEIGINLGLFENYPHFLEPNRDVVVEIEEIDKDTSVDEEVVAKYADKMRYANFEIKHKLDTQRNQKLFLNACLTEANWKIVGVDNQPMAMCAGVNIIIDNTDTVDNVLYGRDSKPLAIVEYTTTAKNLLEGRKIAMRKAEKLKTIYGYLPIVYYYNNYHLFVIDQLGFEPRRVFQIHKLEELELLIQRQTLRKSIDNPKINEDITNREYQKEAIRAACKKFASFKRKTLLVMATGTGKTRVSISLVDVLTKANWVKNVLFLADRTSLVRQAQKAYNKLLPSITTSVYIGENYDRDPNARIIFSTYQTMINLINDDTREFSIGRFDLIIVDEAHRSIFRKYKALFEYFDALMLGLTATPRSEENKSTYEMFNLPHGEPDFDYELNQAVKEGYLVDYTIIDKTSSENRRKLTYDDLTEKQKEEAEEIIDDSGYDEKKKEEIKQSAIYLDAKAIATMLNDLMQEGLKVDGGDKIGKTIIFAKNHFEAKSIVEVFNKIYPHYGKEFCRLIDSTVDEGQTLIDRLTDRDQLPQIAVSVDMLDTGVDVPDILNLVFYKITRSKIKFLQMIGRGTRLSKDIYGPNMDKKGFYIFDYYDNFRYFQVYGGTASFVVEPMSEKINIAKFELLRMLKDITTLSAYDIDYRDKLQQEFITSVKRLINDDVAVQHNMAYVNKYRLDENWKGLDDDKNKEILNKIIPLIPSYKTKQAVKYFDYIMFRLKNELVSKKYANTFAEHIVDGICKSIDEMMKDLLEVPGSIPDIKNNEKIISELTQSEDYFEKHNKLEDCVNIRKQLREVMVYLPEREVYYILVDGDVKNVPPVKTYVEKVDEFIDSGHQILAKIRNLDYLTDTEKQFLEDKFKKELGDEANFINWANGKSLLHRIRCEVKIDDKAIEKKFGHFLNDKVLTESQFIFANQVVDYAHVNGNVTFRDLINESPFSDVDIQGLFGENIKYIQELVNGINLPIQ